VVLPKLLQEGQGCAREDAARATRQEARALKPLTMPGNIASAVKWLPSAQSVQNLMCDDEQGTSASDKCGTSRAGWRLVAAAQGPTAVCLSVQRLGTLVGPVGTL
jgi:hypothetical protein